MITESWYVDRLQSACASDQRWFSDATKHLPVRDEDTPYHSQAHCVRQLRSALDLCDNPQRVLEIGFCLGHSASVMLELGVQNVLSLEVSQRPQTAEAIKCMAFRYGSRHRLMFRDEHTLNRLTGSRFGMTLIDGAHDFASIMSDIELCKALRIPFLLFDDVNPRWGPGTIPAIRDANLNPVAILGNYCLCTP